MKEKFVNLTDGTRLEVKINFGTLYYLQNNGGNNIAKRIQQKQERNKKPSDSEIMEFTAKVIHAMLRSNGKVVTFDEALTLMPSDLDDVQAILDEYKEECERIKKKQKAKEQMKNFSQK